MKVTIFAAQTVNGLIARNNGSEDFLSDINWWEFKKLAEKNGCLILGRKAFESAQKYDLNKVKCFKIIISEKNLQLSNEYLQARTPRDALRKAGEKGFKTVLIGGGGVTNYSFIKEGLVNRLIINVEPAVLGSGVKTFFEMNFERKLKLLNVKKLREGIVRLEYEALN